VTSAIDPTYPTEGAAYTADVRRQFATAATEITALQAGELIAGLGAWGATPPATKPTVSGSRSDGTALASLLSALAAYGLITDSSTA
jgi:hypothetical protein